VSERDEIRTLLGALDVPPPGDLTPRVLAAAAPLLAVHARRVRWRTWLRPFAAALVPLPFVLAFDVTVLRWLHDVLGTLLPAALTTYLVTQYAIVLVLILALTYAAVPVLAERQLRAALQEAHA